MPPLRGSGDRWQRYPALSRWARLWRPLRGLAWLAKWGRGIRLRHGTAVSPAKAGSESLSVPFSARLKSGLSALHKVVISRTIGL